MHSCHSVNMFSGDSPASVKPLCGQPQICYYEQWWNGFPCVQWMDSYIDDRWWGGQWNMRNGYSTHFSYSITDLGPLKPTNEFNLWHSCHFGHGWMGSKPLTDFKKEVGKSGHLCDEGTSILSGRWLYQVWISVSQVHSPTKMKKI